MRLSFRRIIVFCYLMICGILSLLNYRYSNLSDVVDSIHNNNNNTATLFDRSNNNFMRKAYANDEAEVEAAERAPSPSFLSELWYLMTKNPRPFRKKTLSNSSTHAPATVKSLDTSTIIPIWPEDSNATDRVLEQLNYINTLKLKSKQITIYLPHGIGSWNVLGGKVEFEHCLAKNCIITDKETSTYDAAVHRNTIVTTVPRNNQDQIWIFYSLESPDNTGLLIYNSMNVINWTATYRYDSDIVTPYEKYSLYSKRTNHKVEEPLKNYAKGKTKKVAWFVSNCFTNNDRLRYARTLSSFINVDIYGSCGELKCSRWQPSCYEMLKKDYKFYLAFENSNCKDYITEKFFFNGLQHDIIPIVMGARKEEYERVAPPHSFIHVDDFDSPQNLASYLQILDSNETLYNEYFRWKTMGEFVNTKFWCRLCSMLNEPKRKFYANFENWWRNPNVCTREKWQKNT